MPVAWEGGVGAPTCDGEKKGAIFGAGRGTTRGTTGGLGIGISVGSTLRGVNDAPAARVRAD